MVKLNMTDLYFMNSCHCAQSGLWAWQKEVYKAASRWEHHLFTADGIKELVAKLQKKADGLKGKEREIRLNFEYHNLNPYISIGPGCSVSFTKVEGSWAPMVEKVEAVRGEVVSVSHHNDIAGIFDITLRFINNCPLKSLTGKDVLVTMEEVEQ